MEIPACMAVAMSGLVLAGGAVLMVIPADSKAMASTPQQMTSGHRERHHSEHHRNRCCRQHTVISNRVTTISWSDSQQLQRQLMRQLLNQLQRHSQEHEQGPIGVVGGAGGGGGGGR